ncbi:MAG: hypothetical protein PHS92_04820 [Candidatus Gracilibacteria bacterium]|nr:hypothetical protein [Candidatus Gracilibacteria bacterium]
MSSYGNNGMSSNMSSESIRGVQNPIIRTRLDNAKGLIEKWKRENSLYFTIRRNLSQMVKIDSGNLVIGQICWNLDYIMYDFFENGMKDMDKAGLRLPSIEDIHDSSDYLPGDTITERTSNLLSLLGFEFNNDQAIWLNDIEDKNIGSGKKPYDSVIKKVSGKIKRLTGKHDKKKDYNDVLNIGHEKIDNPESAADPEYRIKMRRGIQSTDKIGYFVPIMRR